MRIDIIETHIEADARELRESNTLADNLSLLLARCFQSQDPLDDEEDEGKQNER